MLLNVCFFNYFFIYVLFIYLFIYFIYLFFENVKNILKKHNKRAKMALDRSYDPSNSSEQLSGQAF
jgi:hypothetical protein